MGQYHVGDEKTSVNHIRPGAGAGLVVVGVPNGRGQRVWERMVARDTSEAPRWDGFLRQVCGCMNNVVRLDEVDLYLICQPNISLRE